MSEFTSVNVEGCSVTLPWKGAASRCLLCNINKIRTRIQSNREKFLLGLEKYFIMSYNINVSFLFDPIVFHQK